MEDSLARIQSAYTAVVFFFIIPRYVLIKAFAEGRHSFIVFFVLAIFIVNIVVYAIFFPSTKVPAFYNAMLGPFMALWLSVVGRVVEESRKQGKNQKPNSE